MSNVLIGIIGVILFIGLALAGAMILGDDFRSANVSSKATAHITRIQQVIAAAHMYQLKTGSQIPSTGSIAFLSPRFLKPIVGTADWTAPQIGPGGGKIIAYSYLLGTGPVVPICEEIQRMTNQVGPDAPPAAAMTIQAAAGIWSFGCVIHNGTPTVFATM